MESYIQSLFTLYQPVQKIPIYVLPISIIIPIPQYYPCEGAEAS